MTQRTANKNAAKGLETIKTLSRVGGLPCLECLQGKKLTPLSARITQGRRYGNPPTRVTLAAP